MGRGSSWSRWPRLVRPDGRGRSEPVSSGRSLCPPAGPALRHDADFSNGDRRRESETPLDGGVSLGYGCERNAGCQQPATHHPASLEWGLRAWGLFDIDSMIKETIR